MYFSLYSEVFDRIWTPAVCPTLFAIAWTTRHHLTTKSL
jgi:hypothetical protein